ncbi:MAG: glycine--tRNA ligase subunit beta [Gammaproteobacteria bacterium WSBS_2016_MAG_OTU1]
MSDKNTLLVEIRTEELPPKVLWDFSDLFPGMLLTALKKSGFADYNSQRAKNDKGKNKILGTPRRLVALLQDIEPESAATEIYRRGPQLAACHDSDKNPTKALIGFMHSVGVTCENNLIRTEEKGKIYIAWKGMQAGKKLSAELAAIVENVLFNLPSPRLMRWGDNDFKFARPVHGLLMLHGDNHISGKIMNIAAAKTTFGHPVLSKGKIAINNTDDYEIIMKKTGFVIVDIHQRLENIWKQIYDIAHANPSLLPPEKHNLLFEKSLTKDPLLHEVAAMCEYPKVHLRTFDNDFISLPHRCVSQCMKNHQRFLPLYEYKNLSRHYFLVADNAPADPENMLRGYDTVLRARLRDVKFYYETDKKIALDEYVEKLKSIIFHNKLGNQHARINRVCRIAVALGYSEKEIKEIEKIAEIILAPLSTLMVNEYPELQTDMAESYFNIGNARNSIFILVCHLYDLEKIVGMFGIGEIATGSKDPHGLRRCAHDLVTQLSNAVFNLSKTPSIRKLIAAAVESFDGKIADVNNEVYDFILERVRSKYISGCTTESVLSQKPDSFLHVTAKIIAVSIFIHESPSECTILAAADKRIKNILRKSNMDAHDFTAPDESLFKQDEERDLWNCLKELQKESDAQIAKTDFESALQTLAKAAKPIDTFFDKVLVNAEDEKIRNNRFALLNKTKELLNQVCDISKLEARHD